MNVAASLIKHTEKKQLVKVARFDIVSFEHYLYYLGLEQSYQESHLINVQVFFDFMINNLNRKTKTKKNLMFAITKYKDHLDQLLVKNNDFISERNALLSSLTYYIHFLYEIKRIDVQPDYSLLTLKEPLFDDLGCSYFREYIRSFCSRNYNYVGDKISAIKHFLRHVSIPANEVEKLTLGHVRVYEKKQFVERVLREEITKQTARRKLDQVKCFLVFLRNHGVINFPYSVPREFYGTETRDNEFVKKEVLEKFYTTMVHTKSSTGERDLCIFLLLVETGCRPIEICNLTYSDFNETESLVSFTSIKSDRRNLKIDPYIKEYLLSYIKKNRKSLLSKETIFCKEDGTPLNTDCINAFFKKYNKQTFGQIVFSAKSLRHTYITNALDEKNDFDQVSKSVGHKNWRSTMHYLHRSIKRLLDNTLQYNPNRRSGSNDI